MRFIVMVKASKDSEAGKMPSEELLGEMAKFNEELVKAGIMLDGNGLHPSSKGARIRFAGNKRSVVDGPFAETKELVAGYWILQCKSLAEAVEWIKRCPNPHLEEGDVEIRQLFELGCKPLPSSMTPAFTISSLNFAMSPSNCSDGITPASESLVALTNAMNRIVLLLVSALTSRACPSLYRHVERPGRKSTCRCDFFWTLGIARESRRQRALTLHFPGGLWGPSEH